MAGFFLSKITKPALMRTMRLIVRAIGKLPEAWQREACSSYAERLGAMLPLQVQECPEGHGGSAKPDPERAKAAEAENLLRGLPQDAVLIALDEHGKPFSSEAFAESLDDWSERGQRPLAFCIGGSWGLDAAVRAKARATVAFGPLTLPHGLARIVLLEQLYRAAMIRAGRAYHK